jgi:hypothetical protein
VLILYSDEMLYAMYAIAGDDYHQQVHSEYYPSPFADDKSCERRDQAKNE